MNSHKHKLFEQYPITKKVRLSIGEVPTPYHVYSGYGVFIGGFANIDSVRDLIKDEQVVPVQTIDGEALVGIWVLDFTEASLGQHHELQISIFVNHEEVSDLSSYPFSLAKAMLTRQEVKMMCHGLWNNTEKVVAYNRELLSLNAQRTKSRIQRQGDIFSFEFREQENNQLILSGECAKFGKASMRANIEMLKQIGLMQMLQLTRQSWVSMQVVNPTGVELPYNAIAKAFAKNDRDVINFFDEDENTLNIENLVYGTLGFRPLFVQYMEGFKFAYLVSSDKLSNVCLTPR